MDALQSADRSERVSLSWRRKLLFTGLLLVVTWLLAEVALRIVGYDFADPRRALQQVPPFYRQPTEALAEFTYMRPGDIRWQGQPLQQQLRNQGFNDTDYDHEPVRDFRYDGDGFRNPVDLVDWEIVVVGDSFTELGYLPVEDLFTSVLARQLNCSVKNLGVSHTGPLTYLVYLEKFGLAESTRAAVLVFFEGNDLDDLQLEEMRRQRSRQPGYRHQGLLLEQHQPQLSLSLALLDWFSSGSPQAVGSAANATFRAAGIQQRVTVNYAPDPLVEDGQRHQLLTAALDRWKALCRQHQLDVWLLYMPCKHRVLADFLQLDGSAHPLLRAWRPNNLRGQLRDLCLDRDINFIDPTVHLSKMAAQGESPFNTVYDTHLNQAGSAAVGQLLAEELAP